MQGGKVSPGGTSFAWAIGTAGSQKKIGRGTSINGSPVHNNFTGVVPPDPAHQDVTSERFDALLIKISKFLVNLDSLKLSVNQQSWTCSDGPCGLHVSGPCLSSKGYQILNRNYQDRLAFEFDTQMGFGKSHRMIRTDGYSAAMQSTETLAGAPVASYSPSSARCHTSQLLTPCSSGSSIIVHTEQHNARNISSCKRSH
eukprot:scaffold100582_cov45-Prasinocladus_malaysianus.AAC.1